MEVSGSGTVRVEASMIDGTKETKDGPKDHQGHAHVEPSARGWSTLRRCGVSIYRLTHNEGFL